jgi:hypothetical protein
MRSQGRPDKTSEARTFLEDIGVSKQRVSEWRDLRDAEVADITCVINADSWRLDTILYIIQGCFSLISLRGALAVRLHCPRSGQAVGELFPLEVGLHAQVGMKQQTLSDRIAAARVVDATAHAVNRETDYRLLSAIQPAPRWLWPALVAAMAADTTRVVNGDLWRHLAEINPAPEWLRTVPVETRDRARQSPVVYRITQRADI